MKQALLIAALLCGPALAPAQEKKEEPPPEKIAKMFELKHANMERVYSMLDNLVGRTNINYNTELRLLVVKADKSLMPAVEEVVRRLDVPLPPANNVELTVYILQASQQPGPESRMPDDLQAAIKQLKSVFAYQGFRLLDVALLRSRSGESAQTNGVLTFDRGLAQSYGIQVRPEVTQDEKGRLIRLGRLQLQTRVPLPLPPNAPPDQRPPFEGASINSTLDIREGQKVVVGKTGIEGSDKALVLVVSGKVVD